MLSVDGNAAAGIFTEIFAVEITSAHGRCSGCGHVSAVGEMVTYEHGMGAVLRCPGCGNVMLRVSLAGRARYLDTAGCTWLRFDQPAV